MLYLAAAQTRARPTAYGLNLEDARCSEQSMMAHTRPENVCPIPLCRVWDLMTGQTRSALVGHPSHVHCVAVSADGNTAVSCGFDKAVRCGGVGVEMLHGV